MFAEQGLTQSSASSPALQAHPLPASFVICGCVFVWSSAVRVTQMHGTKLFAQQTSQIV